MYSAVLFHSTSSALRMDKLCRAAGLDIKLIPVPRHLSSDCGVCLRVLTENLERVRHLIDANSIEVEGIKEI